MITVSTYFTYDITFLFSYLKFKNSFSGNFMMVDVTSHTNSDAAMSSATVSQSGQRQYCLSFWFSMNGPSVHMLAVYVYFLSADGIGGNMLSSETGRSYYPCGNILNFCMSYHKGLCYPLQNHSVVIIFLTFTFQCHMSYILPTMSEGSISQISSFVASFDIEK